MAGRKLHLMNPESDKIFREAYFKTMHEAELLEKQKNREDRIQILKDLFEQDLATKDLTVEERKKLVHQFEETIRLGDQKQLSLDGSRRNAIKICLIVFASTLIITGSLLINAYRPFTSRQEIEQKLSYYLEQVDKGYGAYSKNFYSDLSTYSLKFEDQEINKLRDKMHSEIEQHFEMLLVQLEGGEIRFYDDANEWATYFPDSEEQDARKEEVNNAFSKGVGKAIDQGVDKLVDKAGSVFQRLLKIFK